MTTTVRPSTDQPGKPPAPVALSGYFTAYVRRVRGGEMGSLPAVLGLLVLVIVFSGNPGFLTAGNFANLLPQSAPYVVIAMGLIFVLLLGEIDLSAGYTSGVAGALMAVAVTEHGLPWYVAIAVAIVTGVVIGLTLGTLVAKLRIPSFVVTLAAFLAFQGVLLFIVHDGQIIPINDSVLIAIANRNLPVWLGWALYGISILGYALVQLRRLWSRRDRGLSHEPLSLVGLRVLGLAVVAGLAVYELSLERSVNPQIKSLKGVPIVVPIVLVLVVLLTFVLRRTRYGLHMYAVGGNTEAARRAGIPTDRLRISAFVLCSTLAAVGGIIEVSRANSVDPNTGGNTVLLYSVGAAVIGGTSLFGGKGRIVDAVLGGLVVATIDNGMDLGSSASWQKYVVTGVVLLAAAGVDSLSRRRSSTVGAR
jgi:D-xylose transport system permease protein